MTPLTPRDLLAQLEAMPPGALVPAAWLAEQLAALTPPMATDPEVYGVAQLAGRWGRSASAIRALLESGALADAWKQGGKAWRVPLARVLRHETKMAALVTPRAPLASRAQSFPPEDPHGLRRAAGARRRRPRGWESILGPSRPIAHGQPKTASRDRTKGCESGASDSERKQVFRGAGKFVGRRFPRGLPIHG